MHTLLTILFAVVTAFLAAGILALIKIGSSAVLRFFEKRWQSRGVIILILCWLFLLPIMVLVSIVVGFYLYLTVKPSYV